MRPARGSMWRPPPARARPAGGDAPGAVIDVAAARGAAERRWAAAAERAGQTVVVAECGSARTAWCAEADLDRIIDALVENALAYSPPGSTVTLACTPHGLTVTD